MSIEFKTPVVINQPSFEFSHEDRILLMGSCFAEHIGSKLDSNKFNVDVNPFGTLYNPSSILASLQLLKDQKTYDTKDIFEHDGIFHSFTHHSRFSSTSQQETLTKINDRLTSSSQNLIRATRLIFTLGTAYLYRLKSNGEVVANCHKLPDKFFERELLSVETIVDDWVNLLTQLWEQNPSLKVLFTVSPIRHWKDGAHGNQISKSTLLLAIYELEKMYPDKVSYFPAYEIMMDELRDYRFYADDMLHPSALAVEYIWERFSDTYFSKQTKAIVREWRDIDKAINHKPFQSDSDKYRHFIMQTLLKSEQIMNKFPYFDLSKEIALLKSKLK